MRVGAGLHILFEIFTSDEDAQCSDDITEGAIVAAINFTELCNKQRSCQGRVLTIMEDIENIKASKLKLML